MTLGGEEVKAQALNLIRQVFERVPENWGDNVREGLVVVTVPADVLLDMESLLMKEEARRAS